MEHNASITCYYELRNLVYHVIKEGCNVNYRDLDERRYNQKLFRHFEELYFTPNYLTSLKINMIQLLCFGVGLTISQELNRSKLLAGSDNQILNSEGEY